MQIMKKSAAVFSLAIPLVCQACESGVQGSAAAVSEGLSSYHSAESDSDDRRSRRRRHRDGRRRGRAGAAGAASTAGQGGNEAESSNAGAGGAGAASSSGSAGQPPAANGGSPSPAPSTGQRYQPKPGTSWQYQLTGTLDTSVSAELFDIDLFETTSAQITDLHAAGRKVICYFDTAYEPYRADAAALEPYRGNPMDGWPGQYWVDFRQAAVVDVMLKRLDVAQSKGCDAVEADDVDARDNDPGFPIGAADQRQFVIELAEAAHARGLAFGLKNALEDVPALVSYADFAVNEECLQYDECEALEPFVQAGKPVFHVEYGKRDLASYAAEACPRAQSFGFETLIKNIDLDAARFPCL